MKFSGGVAITWPAGKPNVGKRSRRSIDDLPTGKRMPPTSWPGRIGSLPPACVPGAGSHGRAGGCAERVGTRSTGHGAIGGRLHDEPHNKDTEARPGGGMTANPKTVLPATGGLSHPKD